MRLCRPVDLVAKAFARPRAFPRPYRRPATGNARARSDLPFASLSRISAPPPHPGNPATVTSKAYGSRLCMLEGFVGHAEQCNIRVRRYGHKNVAYRTAAE